MTDNLNYYLGGVHQTLEGAFKVWVVDAKTEKVVWEQPDFEKNLILNNGMNSLTGIAYANTMTYGIAGTGTRVNSADGNLATVSQAGTTVTLTTNPSFVSFTSSLAGYAGGTLEVGDTIVYDTGAGGIDHVLVTGGITGTSCTVQQTVAIPATTFTVWKTSQTGLQFEQRRAGSPIANTAMLGGVSSFVGNVMTMQRTWDFAPEVSLVNYTEVGVGWDYHSNTTTVFSRLLLPSAIPVDVGQKIRLAYQLQVTVGPIAATPRPDATITGWTQTSPSGSTTQGSESIQTVVYGSLNGSGQWPATNMSYVDYNGNTQGNTALEPVSTAGNCSFFLSTNSTALQSFNSAVDRTGANIGTTSGFAGFYGDGGVATTQNAYILNTFTINKTATHGLYHMNSSNIRSMGFGYSYGTNGYWYSTQPQYQAFCFLFNLNQTKASTQTLTMAYTWTWDRSFVA